MKIWKILCLTSFIVAVVRCDDDTVNVAENEVDTENKEENLIRQKKSHPSTTCVTGMNSVASNSGDEYTVSSSSNYFVPPVQPGYGPSPQMQQQQRQSFASQIAQYIPQHSGYGPQPASFGQFAPSSSYKPASANAAYGPPQQPQRPSYGLPQSLPSSRPLYGAPVQPVYRAFDGMDHYGHGHEMIDHHNMQRFDMMDQVGSFHNRPIPQHVPYHAASAPASPAPCSQQFTVSCTPQIYAAAKQPLYQPVYYPPAPVYAPPKYTPSPIVYSSVPESLYGPPSMKSLQHAYRNMDMNNNVMPNTNMMQPQSNNMASSSGDGGQMMNKNTSTAPIMRNNESSNQQQSQPKNSIINSNDVAPPKVGNMLKLADQMKENEKKSGPIMGNAYSWGDKPM